LDRKDASKIYKKIIKNIIKQIKNNNFYIFYISGINKYLTSTFFEKFNLEQVFYKKIYKGFYLPITNDFYIYKNSL
jgi:hypothetical protein